MKTFELVGIITYDVGSCHDDRMVEIREEIKALNTDNAISKAREITGNLHSRYKFQTDYYMELELKENSILVWKTHSVEGGEVPTGRGTFHIQQNLTEDRVV